MAWLEYVMILFSLIDYSDIYIFLYKINSYKNKYKLKTYIQFMYFYLYIYICNYTLNKYIRVYIIYVCRLNISF